jgi:hypothetical protein
VSGQNDDDASRTIAGATAAAARTPSGKDMPPLGTVMGARFQLEEVLGRGGTGVVFRAFDRVMGEAVAVKLLFPERAADEGWIRRLVREVKVARTLVHPNVRRIFEIGQVEGYWLVTMELGAGSLGDRLRGRRDEDDRPLPPWPTRRDDARAVVDGLAAIHAAGITHRDVTPNNILRMSDGRLVLSDFGLALLEGETTALIAGTPNYVAPEVLAGERADQRSDVWQLGLVLHEIIFERRPRWQRTSARQDLLPPVRVDAATPIDDVMQILGACLSVEPARRAATAVEIAQAFERDSLAGARRGTARTARPRGAANGARPWRTRALVVAALAALGIGAGTRLPGILRARRLAAVAVVPTPAPAPSAPALVAAPSTAATTAPAPTRIRVRIESRPSHARVIDVATAEVWGLTPLDVERTPSSDGVSLRLVKARFESTIVTIGGDRDVHESVELRPSHETPPTAEPPETSPAAPATLDPPSDSEPGKL